MGNEFAKIDLSKYEKIRTNITGANEEAIAKLKQGDVLKILQHRNRGKQAIDVFTPSGKETGRLLQGIVDELTFKRDIGPDVDKDYDDEDYFYMINGHAVFLGTSINKGKKKHNIEFYFKRT